MAQPEWHLGQTSAHYESHGPGTISSGKGDHGGISYGTYQFSTSPNGGSLKEYLRDSAYKDHFKGLGPKTPEFDAKWKELAKSDSGFAQDQHNAIKKTHYDPMVAKLKADGLDVSTRGPAVQDALWSTSVQFGPGHHNGSGGADVFENGLNEKFGTGYDLSKLSDKDIVEAVQDYKIKHNEHLFSGSPKLWASLKDRAKHEKADLLKLVDHEKTLDKNGTARDHVTGPRLDNTKNPDHAPYEQARTTASDVLRQGAQGQTVHDLQANLAKLGYKDSQDHPLKADGHFGLDTRHAVERFQHDHHLSVDSIAGPKTLEALHHAQAEHVAPSLADPKNPDHALYEQGRAAVHQLDASMGRTSDRQSDQLAASLVVAAKREGMTAISEVRLSDDGSRAFAVQGRLDSPLRQIAFVQTAEAVNTPVDKSSATVLLVNQQQQAPAPVPAQAQPAPAMAR